MAHRPLSRSTVTAGLTAALLTLPMAGAAVGLGETAEDSLDETSKAVEETVEDVVDDDGDASTAEAEDATTSAADPDVDDLREVVEKTTQGDVEGATESATSTVSEAAESTTDAVGEVLGDPTGGPGDASGGGGEAAEVPAEPQGPTRSGSAPRSEPDGVFSDRTASTSSGFSARYGGTSTSPSTYSPPATSGVFDQDSPETVDDETLRSAQDPDVASLSSVPRPGDAAGPSASGVPGTLLATATALLVLVGAGHALHGIRRLDVA